MCPDPETIRIYDTRAADYARVVATSTPGALLSAFIAAIPAGGRVLDLGCGPGLSAAWMAKAGLKADAVDASAEMVTLAAAHPGVTAWQASFDDLDATAHYDGIWANFSLLHAPRADMPGHLAAIHRALRPGGQFHIALKTGTDEARDSLGRLYTYYTPDALTALLTETGFTVTKTTTGRDKGLDGSMADWVSLAAHG